MVRQKFILKQRKQKEAMDPHDWKASVTRCLSLVLTKDLKFAYRTEKDNNSRLVMEMITRPFS